MKGNNYKLKRQELKKPGTNFGNVFEVYYLKTALEKEDFELQEARYVAPCASTKCGTIQLRHSFL